MNDKNKNLVDPPIQEWETEGSTDEVSNEQLLEEQVQVREEAETAAENIDAVPEPKSETNEEPEQEGYIDNMPITEEALNDLEDDYLKVDPRVVGYRNLEEQSIVYDFVASNFDASSESVLDIGCGRGDFLRHLQGIYQDDVVYHGVDLNKVLIGTAKELNPEGTFTATNLFKLDGNYASDWVVNIGGLSIAYEPGEYDQMDALKNTVSKMMELADTAIVISLLSMNTSEDYDESYMVYDPVEVLDWALNEYGQLGGNVRLDHSIADSIFTLTIYK
jgi:SAM-dependent methyltransferase